MADEEKKDVVDVEVTEEKQEDKKKKRKRKKKKQPIGRKSSTMQPKN